MWWCQAGTRVYDSGFQESDQNCNKIWKLSKCDTFTTLLNLNEWDHLGRNIKREITKNREKMHSNISKWERRRPTRWDWTEPGEWDCPGEEPG